MRHFFHQANGAERKAVLKMFALALAEDEFRAAAPDVQQQQRQLRQFRIGRHTLERPFGLLIAGDDLHFQRRGRLDGGDQLLRVHRITRRARRNHANGNPQFNSQRSGLVIPSPPSPSWQSAPVATDSVSKPRLSRRVCRLSLKAKCQTNIVTLDIGHEQLH